MSIDELRREVVVSRRRKRRAQIAVLVGIVVPAQLACLMWVLRPREHVRVVHTTSTEIVAMPAPVPFEHVVNVPTERASCPPPRRDARFVAPASLPEAVARVRPSVTNAGWIAAWNDDTIYISMDAGASWTQRLDGEGVVRDVAFDCYGRAIAVRGRKLGILDGDGVHWEALPGLRLTDDDLYGRPHAVVLGGGPDVAVIGHALRSKDGAWTAALVVSHDLGLTWQHRTLADYWEGGDVHGRQHEDGTILAMIPQADCMHDDPWVFRWRAGELEQVEAAIAADLAFFGDRMISSKQWQHIGSPQAHDLPALDYLHPTLIEGPYPILITPDGAYRVDGKQPKLLPWQLDGNEVQPVADPAGRIWSVRCGQPHVSTKSKPTPCERED